MGLFSEFFGAKISRDIESALYDIYWIHLTMRAESFWENIGTSMH